MYSLIIVDDDELIRRGLEKVIQWGHLGYEVKGTFKSAIDALEYIKYNRVDVILTDIRMPQMSGLDLVGEARKCHEGIKAVIISGYGEFELAKQALVLKVEDYLLKPLGEDEINSVFLKLKKSLDKERSSEAVASYYLAALDLSNEEKKNSVIHYKRERDSHKRGWDRIQVLRKQMIVNLETGRFREIDEQLREINSILEHYEGKDRYYFYSSIVMKLLKYFALEETGADCFFSQRSYQSAGEGFLEPEQLKKHFAQDIDTIRRELWEKSDSMRRLTVAKAKAIIEAEYGDESLSLASVANRLNISYGYLSTIFTKTEGRSFKSYLVEIRMEKARTLLLSRNYRIYEIAEMVGYKNPRYFTDAFKKYYSYSPAEYIARFRGKEDL